MSELSKEFQQLLADRPYVDRTIATNLASNVINRYPIAQDFSTRFGFDAVMSIHNGIYVYMQRISPTFYHGLIVTQYKQKDPSSDLKCPSFRWGILIEDNPRDMRLKILELQKYLQFTQSNNLVKKVFEA